MIRDRLSDYIPNPTFEYVAAPGAWEDYFRNGNLCSGTLSRFPQLKFAIVENGSAWLEPLFKQLNGVHKKMPGSFEEHPVDAIKRCIHFSPFWEEDLVALAALLGEDRVLFGSDYPHPEGLAEPRSYIAEITANKAGNDELVRKIMGGNLARLMKIPAELSVPA